MFFKVRNLFRYNIIKYERRTLSRYFKWNKSSFSVSSMWYVCGNVDSVFSLFPGFGMTAPSTFEGQLFFIFYALIGIPLNILFLNTALQKIVSLLSDLVRSGYNKIPRNKFLTPPGPKELPLGEILIASFVIYSFVTLLLAIAFTFIEGWSFFQAIYFLIVACSTVGFGDYVPSKTTTGVGHNVHDGYRISNWFMISIGLVLIYVVLNLLANFFKNVLGKCIHLCRMKFCPCLNTQIEPYDSQKTRMSAATSNRRTVSRISFANDLDGPDLGSFAAIQVALDRLKLEAGADDEGSNTELKALSNIEKILKAEYFRVKSRKKSNSVKSRWKRAAQKARQLSPNQETGKSTEETNAIGKSSTSVRLEDANYEELPGAVLN